MTTLFQKAILGTALIVGLVGCLPTSINAEEQKPEPKKKIEIEYNVNASPYDKVMRELTEEEDSPDNIFIERYNSDYTGDKDAGEFLEEATHIKGGDFLSHRCFKFSPGRVGTSVRFGIYGRIVNPREFQKNVSEADIDRNKHVDFAEAEKYYSKATRENYMKYPECNDDFYNKMLILQGKSA